MNKLTNTAALLLPTLLLSACNDALVFGEGTNFSLATVKVNSDVAEPISVNAGLDRTIGATAPPQGDNQEAMNMVSRFELKTDEKLFGEISIASEFASGKAATNMVNYNKPAALEIMNLKYAPQLSQQAVELRKRLIDKVKAQNDQDRLKLIARDMNLAGTADPKLEIVRQLNAANEAELTGYRVAIDHHTGG